MSSFQQQTKAYKKQESMACSEIIRNCPWKRPDGRYTRQRLWNNCLKDAQKTKEVEKVKKMIHEQNGDINER